MPINHVALRMSTLKNTYKLAWCTNYNVRNKLFQDTNMGFTPIPIGVENGFYTLKGHKIDSIVCHKDTQK